MAMNGTPETNGRRPQNTVTSNASLSYRLPKGQKAIRILLINPNSTFEMADACLAAVQSTLPPDVQVTGIASPYPAPTAIESVVDGVLSAAIAFRRLQEPQFNVAQYDAFLVACFSEHPLITMLREEYDKPCVGIMEAAFFAARTLGGRIGLVATCARAGWHGQDAVRRYGLEGAMAGVEDCGLGVLDLEHKGEREVFGVMVGAAKKLVEGKGADVLVLGCAGMTKLKPVVEKAVGADVQVVDGVVAGVHHLIGMVRMGGRTAKKGVYRSSKVDRQQRGQDYV